MNPITRDHRLSVARAWLNRPGDELALVKSWANSELVTGSFFETLERLAQLVADAEGAWIPVAEWPERAGYVAIGYDIFYNRIGEVEREAGSRRWVFSDSQKDDCDVTMVCPLPKPPEQP